MLDDTEVRLTIAFILLVLLTPNLLPGNSISCSLPPDNSPPPPPQPSPKVSSSSAFPPSARTPLRPSSPRKTPNSGPPSSTT